MSTNRVTVTRRVEAPAPAVFALLSDPGRHPDFDGSGMLVGLLTPGWRLRREQPDLSV
jgi:hypothetical protein